MRIRFYPVIAIVLVMVGCSTSRTKHLLDKATLLSVVADPNSAEADYLSAFGVLRTYQEEASAEFWIKIVNGDAYNSDRKREALVVFFRDHCVGMAVADIAKYPGVNEWFSETNLWSAGANATFETDEDEHVFLFQPELLVYKRVESRRYHPNGAIDFVVKGELTSAELVKILRNEAPVEAYRTSPDSPWITKIRASAGHVKEEFIE